MTINFMVAGDDKYFYLLRENCAHVKARYPEARVIVFDFGLTPGQVASLGAEWPNVEVVDWTAQVDDLSQVRETTPPEQRRKLAIAVNARRTGLAKKIRKFMLKRFPGSATSRRAEDRALWFENLLIQKIQCMKHASTLCAGEPLVFLDADAILFEPIDEVFAEGADVTVTLLDDKHNWDRDQCSVLNSGVIFFGPKTEAREAFLDAWWAETLATREWLREQTALVRFIHRQAPTLFTPNRSETVALNGIDVNVRMVPCSVYNFNDMGGREPETFPHAKIYHFADRRQEKRRFFPLLSTLKARAEKMAKEKPA
ncbi:MAG TPA: hypothetical protein EYM71_12495 [Rhodospirillales bacterium]|nr:hypothetical protein [Rhodospirillales bacterium]